MRRIHVLGVTHIVEMDEANDPLHISFFGANGVVLAPHYGTYLVKQFG